MNCNIHENKTNTPEASYIYLPLKVTQRCMIELILFLQIRFQEMQIL